MLSLNICNYYIMLITKTKNGIKYSSKRKGELLYTSMGKKKFNNFPNNTVDSKLLNEILEINKTKNNVMKFMYQIDENDNKTKVFGEKFISSCNEKKTYLIIKNKKTKLLREINNGKENIFTIKFKNLDNMVNINSLFENCNTLLSLTDISKLRTNYVKNMNSLFSGCSSLIFLDDISKWITNNVNDMNQLFYKCSKLKTLPDISKWNIENVKIISALFGECSSLESLPNIYNWNTSNIIDMSGLFYKCSKLKTLPDISEWNSKNVIFINSLFEECLSLESLPDIYK